MLLSSLLIILFSITSLDVVAADGAVVHDDAPRAQPTTSPPQEIRSEYSLFTKNSERFFLKQFSKITPTFVSFSSFVHSAANALQTSSAGRT